MGNCGSNPKTNEGPDDHEPVPVPEPVTVTKNKEVKVEQQESKAEEKNIVERDAEEIPISTTSDDNSLRTLLNEKKEEAPKAEKVKEEAEEVKEEVVKQEVPKEQEPKREELKIVQEAENKPNSTEEAKVIEA